MADHYIECVDLACEGCLPSDDDVAAMSVGSAVQESMKRGMPRVGRAVDVKQAVLDGADAYRAEAAAARALL